MKSKYPINITILDKPEKSYIISTSIETLHNFMNLRLELSFIESDYIFLTETLKRILSVLSKEKKKDPRLFWLIGDFINKYLDRLSDLGYYLMNQNKTISRDIEISESSIKKIMAFRSRFPKISSVDPLISWEKYRENKVKLDKNSINHEKIRHKDS